jgi:NitT/TauT family transport system substrate-binding protein
MKTLARRTLVMLAAGALVVPAFGRGEISEPAPTGARGGVAWAAETTVKVGLVGQVSDAGFLIGEARGYFRKQGLTLEITRFDSAARMVPLLASGQLDVGGGSPSAGVVNAILGGSRIQIVADKGSFGKDFSYGTFLIRPDLKGRITHFEDLRGKRVAVAAAGTTPHLMLARALGKAGLKLSDVHVSFMGHPDMVVALKTGAIDVAVQFEPQGTRAEQEGVAVAWKEGHEVWPNLQVAVVLFGAGFKNEKVAQQLVNAYVCGLRDYNAVMTKGSQKDRDELFGLLARESRTPVDLLKKARPVNLEPDGRLDVDSLQESVDYLIELGLVKGKFNVSDAVNTRYIEAARPLLRSSTC